MLRSIPEGARRCSECDRQAVRSAELKKDNIIYQCHACLTEIVVPVYFDKIFIGCLSSGQFLTSKPTEKAFKKVLRSLKLLKLDPVKLRKFYFKTQVLTKTKLKALIEFMELLGKLMIENRERQLFFEKINQSDKISLVKKYVEKNFKKKITINDIAKTVYLSSSRFSHLFKAEVGISFIEYLNRFRIEKAGELLENTKLNISEIAINTGFQDISNFNRIFKKVKNSSPREYRKKVYKKSN